LLAVGLVALACGGCGNGGMRISGRLLQGGQPLKVEGEPRLSLINEAGDRFEFDTQADGTFSGPTADDPRPLMPGKYEVLLFVYKPGVVGPQVAHIKEKIELAREKKEYDIEIPPLSKGAAPNVPKPPKEPVAKGAKGAT
jgi:hypothetical protein